MNSHFLFPSILVFIALASGILGTNPANAEESLVPPLTKGGEAPALSSIIQINISSIAAPQVQFAISFSASVSGFTTEDLAVSGQGVTFDAPLIEAGPEVYLMTVSNLAGYGTLSIDVSESFGVLGAGNVPGIVSPEFIPLSINVDRAPPSLLDISAATNAIVSGQSAEFLFTFSEPVTIVTEPDSDAFHIEADGVASGFIEVTGSGTTRTVTVNDIIGEGTLSIGIAPGAVIEDQFGDDLISTDLQESLDVTLAPLELTSITPRVTQIVSPGAAQFDILFSEPAVNVTADDFQVATTDTASVGASSIEGSGTSYVLELADITGFGQISVSLPPGTDIETAAGVPLSDNAILATITMALPPLSLTQFDSVDTILQAGDTATITIGFSRAVLGFGDPGDIVVSSTVAGAQNIVFEGSGSLYTVTIGPFEELGDAEVSLSPGAAITDEFLNPLVGAPESIQIQVVGDRPEFLGFKPTSGLLAPGSSFLYLEFSRPVVGLSTDDFTFTPPGPSVTSIASTSSKRIAIEVDMDGVPSARMELELTTDVEDLLGAPVENPGTYGLDLSYDSTAPALVLVRADPPPPYTEPTNVTLTYEFSDLIFTNLTADMVDVLNASGIAPGSAVTGVTGPTVSYPSSLSVSINTGSSDAPFQVSFPGYAIADLAGNQIEGVVESPAYVLDTMAPSINSIQATPSVAKRGDTVTLVTNCLDSGGAAPERVSITVGGTAATWNGAPPSGSIYTNTFVVPGNMPVGPVDVTVTAEDTFGNRTVRSFDDELTIKLPITISIVSPHEADDKTEDANQSIASDGADTLVAVWESSKPPLGFLDQRIMRARSTDGGLTWNTPAYFSGTPNDSPTGTKRWQFFPLVETQGTNWLAAWIDIPYVSNQSGVSITSGPNVVVSRSTNNGASWSPVSTVGDIGVAAFSGFPNLISLENDGPGNWLIAWSEAVWVGLQTVGILPDEPFESEPGTVYVSRSTNAGVTWSAPIDVTGDAGGLLWNFGARMASDQQGNVVCTWLQASRLTEEGALDGVVLQYARSGDSGQTWSVASPFVVDPDLMTIEIETYGAGKFVALLESANSENPGFFVTRTEDGGISWSSPELVHLPGDGEYDASGIRVSGDIWTVAWVRNYSFTSHDIFITNSSDLGANWSSPTGQTDRAFQRPPEGAALVAASNRRWGFSWWDSYTSQTGNNEVLYMPPPSGDDGSDQIPPTMTVIDFKAYEAAYGRARLRIEFSEGVAGFGNDSDVIVTTTGTLAYGAVSIEQAESAAAYRILVTGLSGEGTLQVSLAPEAGITDMVGNTLSPSSLSDSAFIDALAPASAEFELSPSGVVVGDTATLSLTFSESVTGVESGMFQVVHNGAKADSVAVSGSGSSYQVQLSGVSGQGWLKVVFDSTGLVIDAAGNPAPGPVWSSQVSVDTGEALPSEGEDEAINPAILMLEKFDAADNNNNRFLTLLEARLAAPALTQDLYNEINADSNTGISVAELLAWRGLGYLHHADTDGNRVLDLNELLRVVQLYNANGIKCATRLTEDGFDLSSTGPGQLTCVRHTADYNPADNRISLTELLRIVQFFNTKNVRYCPQLNDEDGFCTD